MFMFYAESLNLRAADDGGDVFTRKHSLKQKTFAPIGVLRSQLTLYYD